MGDFFLYLLIFLGFYSFLKIFSALFRSLFLESPEAKGKRGEAFVNKYAVKYLTDEYCILNNVTLELEEGTTQIDHIIISPYGVFVIETKNVAGWIYGSERQKSWTQTFPTGDKYYFQNPLRQNYKHVKTVQNMLRLKKNQIHNLVVFVGESDFQTDMPDNVTEGYEFISYIKSHTEPVLSDEQAEHLINTIESIRLEDSKETDKKHVDYVMSKKN